MPYVWNSNTLATWCEELTHLKRPWCWERLKAGDRDDRGWDGWMASLTRWTWVWASSRSWWWTGKPGVLQSTGLQRVRQDWATELTELRTEYGTVDCFQIGKGVCQDCILSPWLFNLYAEYTMRNAGLNKSQAGIKVSGRNINNLRYPHDTTLMAESKEELKGDKGERSEWKKLP